MKAIWAKVQHLSAVCCALCVVIAFNASAHAQFDNTHIRAVDADAPGPGHDGLTWETAFVDVQDALDAMNPPAVNEIWVAAASEPYVPSVFVFQFASEIFFLIDGVAIYGGFLGSAHPSGGEDLLIQRDPEMNETVLSGDLNGDDDNATSSCCSIHSGPGCDDPECQSVVCVYDPSCCVVDWDTLCAGLAGSLCGDLCNTSDNARHVVVALDVGNTTALNGFTISRAFTGVGAQQTSGGGMIIAFASPKVVRTRFTENFARNGGGLFVVGSSSAPAEPTLVNFSFIGNSALEFGGGIYIDRFGGLPDVQFVNGVLSGNSAREGGGGLWASFVDGTLTLVNSTLSGNSVVAGEGGGVAIAGGSGAATLTNAILWGNTPDQIDVQPGTTVVSFSDVEGGLPADVIDGGGNIDADPMFCNVAGGNLRLQDGSPCIDTGDDGAVPQDLADVDDDGNTGETLPWDLDTRSRQFDGNAGGTLVDMGAYENQHDQLCPADLDGDCSVGASDLLSLLASWGPCPGCAADLDCNLVVGASDLLSLLASWGLCACGTGPGPLTLQEELDDACLTMDDWDAFVAVMTDPESSQADKDRYLCWMEHYLFDCNRCICIGASGCPGPDPFN